MYRMLFIGLGLLFALTLSASHFALRNPQIRDFEMLWVYVEYVWLVAALVSLVSAGRELQKLNRQLDAQNAKDVLSREWNSLRISTRSRLQVVGPTLTSLRQNAVIR